MGLDYCAWGIKMQHHVFQMNEGSRNNITSQSSVQTFGEDYNGEDQKESGNFVSGTPTW